MNNTRDFALARDEHWYRIPVDKAHRWGKHHWPPKWLAFYQTRAFKDHRFCVRYYARVRHILKVQRRDLLPNESFSRKAGDWYYQLMLGPLKVLSEPIPSLRERYIHFIPTTLTKFFLAEEINDLWDDSPLEDRLWAELKRLRLAAERQEFVTLKRKRHPLDFAFYCAKGNLNVETDGARWHSDPRSIACDNRRDNALEAEGWRLLRFNTLQIRDEMADYCIPTILEVVSDLGGLPDEIPSDSERITFAPDATSPP
jgi:very-short-patch-repair endonuclease